MRVFQFLDTYYPAMDGVITAVQNIIINLNKKIECKLVVPKPSKKSKYVDNESFEVIRCMSIKASEGYRNGKPFADVKLIERIAKEDCDLFHAHSPFAMGKFALFMAKKKNIPVVMSLHTKYHEDFLRVTKSRFLSWIAVQYILPSYKHAYRVWTVSEYSKDVLRSYGYKGEIDVVRNGTEFTYPENAEELREKINKIHNLENEKNVFLFVGRMAFYKNIKMIADALSILKGKNIKCKMLFVGGGFDLKKFKKYVEKRGVGDMVICTDCVKDRELLQGYYLRAESLIFPSTFDTSGIVKVEAAAHKLPTVLIEGSCSAEGVTDGENGYLCKENPESLAKKMEYLCSNIEDAKRVGNNAYKTIYRSWAMVAEEVLEKYKQIIEDYKKEYGEKKI